MKARYNIQYKHAMFGLNIHLVIFRIRRGWGERGGFPPTPLLPHILEQTHKIYPKATANCVSPNCRLLSLSLLRLCVTPFYWTLSRLCVNKPDQWQARTAESRPIEGHGVAAIHPPKMCPSSPPYTRLMWLMLPLHHLHASSVRWECSDIVD